MGTAFSLPLAPHHRIEGGCKVKEISFESGTKEAQPAQITMGDWLVRTIAWSEIRCLSELKPGRRRGQALEARAHGAKELSGLRKDSCIEMDPHFDVIGLRIRVQKPAARDTIGINYGPMCQHRLP